MADYNYDNTYWCERGRLQSLYERVWERVPDEGACPSSRPALERLRVAARAYYDLYNNGGCNYDNGSALDDGSEARGLARDLGVPRRLVRYGWDSSYVEMTQELVDAVEVSLDALVVAAAEELLVEGA